ncbi:protein of unknown function [Paraburkholderia steynii]|uniref:Nucleoside 2-deoxyribosyltransferase n=1 Tax=Paraburkholderia steynii TaxID=1245441 RepID=A0A7Z7FL44_9BURK|nr:DUF4406 domain-containing protein [Paraburkholderia steynii]SDI64855.1 protein of unknown function [Paraburkholderia steynii]
MRIYIAGPMTGIPEFNFPAFFKAAARLRQQGHFVINPAEIVADTSVEWAECMKADIRELVTCDAVFMLPGWTASRGARLEHFIALELGLSVEYAQAGAIYETKEVHQ